MGYYQPQVGDYATYGYGMGDPSFLGGLWRGIKAAGRIVLGIPKQPKIKQLPAPRAGTPPILPPSRMPPKPPGGFFPGVGVGAAGGAAVTRLARPTDFSCPEGGCPSGYHLAKDGSGRCVRNRRMNVANPRALRRAIRRTEGFVKLSQRALKGTGYKVVRR